MRREVDDIWFNELKKKKGVEKEYFLGAKEGVKCTSAESEYNSDRGAESDSSCDYDSLDYNLGSYNKGTCEFEQTG